MALVDFVAGQSMPGRDDTRSGPVVHENDARGLAASGSLGECVLETAVQGAYL